MTPAAVITEARKLVHDTLTPYRHSDADLLGFVNQVLRRMAVLRPDLFTKHTSFAMTSSSAIQSLPADAHRLIDVYSVTGKNAVTEIEREVMDRAYPQWLTDPIGVPVNFIRHPRIATSFFVYPRPMANLTLQLEYAVEPPTYTLNDEITYLKDTYIGVVIDGVVFLVSSMDDEHVNSNRAKLFLDSFVQSLGIDMQQRAALDQEPPLKPPPVQRGSR